MRSYIPRVAAAVIAIVSFAAAVMTSRFVFVVLGGLALFFLATSFSTAARLSSQLGRLTSSDVEVRVWGLPLPPGPGDPPMKLEAVRALGAGLHLYFRTGTGARPGHLKVAQPADVVSTTEGLVIGSAAYVQWLGRRLPPSSGVPALTLRRSG